ncbi:MAG: ABC transporter ATP-binding protein [Oscillospiraceae bacterium]|nr:ABC transporter ATP-binding protein [Oscillospiraceae bacterium]
MNTLTAKDVCKSYGSKEVLKHLNLTLEPGCIYGLIGRNGAGKTTLLGILTGQNPMNSGSVTFDGQPVWENQSVLNHICFSRELNSMSILGQNNLKVKEYLRAASIYYPCWDKEYANRLTAEFGVDQKKKVCKLSKGQMSMVTIVIALASRAPITILDEPVAGLDVVARERFYQLLLEDFAQTNRTFVVSTHIIEEAAGVFEKVIILDEGAILEDCPTEDLVRQFHYISGRDEEVDRACAGLNVLVTETMGRHKAVTVRCEEGDLRRLEGFDVDVAPLNLQKVFVALCGHKEGDLHE